MRCYLMLRMQAKIWLSLIPQGHTAVCWTSPDVQPPHILRFEGKVDPSVTLTFSLQDPTTAGLLACHKILFGTPAPCDSQNPGSRAVDEAPQQFLEVPKNFNRVPVNASEGRTSFPDFFCKSFGQDHGSTGADSQCGAPLDYSDLSDYRGLL